MAEKHNREDIAAVSRFNHAVHQLGLVGAVYHIMAESGAGIEAVADQLDCGGGDGFRGQYTSTYFPSRIAGSSWTTMESSSTLDCRYPRISYILIRKYFGRQNVICKYIGLAVVVPMPEAIGSSTHCSCVRYQRSPRITHDWNARIYLRSEGGRLGIRSEGGWLHGIEGGRLAIRSEGGWLHGIEGGRLAIRSEGGTLHGIEGPGGRLAIRSEGGRLHGIEGGRLAIHSEGGTLHGIEGGRLGIFSTIPRVLSSVLRPLRPLRHPGNGGEENGER